MIIDKSNLFSEDQAVTTTVNSTNIIDLGNDSALVQALNEKGDVHLWAQVTTAFNAGTSLKVTLTTDDSSTFASETTVLSSAAVATASLVAGYQFPLGKLPRINEQYARLTYTVVGTHDAGNISAGLVFDTQTNNA